MVTLGVDAHKHTHTIVAVDDQERQLPVTTVGTRTKDHLGLLRWAQELVGNGELRWAVEDCRHLYRRLEKDLLGAGQAVVRVPRKMMAHVRDSARTYGNLTRSTRWPLPGRRCGSPTYPPPGSTGRNEMFGY